MMRFSEPLRLMLERLFCQSFLGICHMWLQICKKKLALYKTIESKSSLPVGYRMIQCESISVQQTRNFTWQLSAKSHVEKPCWIIMAFQTDKSGDQQRNPSILDHCNLTNMFVMLNSRRYPEIDYDDTNFTQQKFSRVYGDAVAFRTKFKM